MKTIKLLLLLFIPSVIFGQVNSVFTFDNLNRLTQVTYGYGATIEYCYDNVGNMTCYEVDGVTQLPDLAISAVEVESTTLGAGSSFSVTALDTNYLSGSAAGHFVRFYLSDDDGFTEGIDEVLGTKFVTGLAGYGSDSIHQVLSIPELAAEGPQYLIVCTDTNGNLVAEADEENNCIAVPIQVNNCGTVSLTFDVTEESCLLENGAISVNVAGGTGPFAYWWNTIPPATTASISDISAGTYTVTVTDGNNCETVSTVSVVNGEDLPSANFDFSADALEVQFSNSSLDGSAFAWDFGDGNTSALSSPAHTYDFSGSYNVCLAISNACGADTTCRVVTVSQPTNTGGGSTPTGPVFSGTFNKVFSHYTFANSGNVKFVESTDNSYVGTTSGWVSSNGHTMPVFIKLDTLGAVINAFELLANDQASADFTSMEPSDDGGFYARYRVYGTNGGADPIANFASFIVRIDKDGQVLWQYRYYEGSNVFNVETMAGLAGDGLIAVGKNETQSKFTLLKLNGGGFREWSSRLTLSGSGFDVAKANATHVTKAPNGDYLIAFQLDQDVSWLHDFCLLRTDANGNTLWIKKFSAPEDEVVRGLEVFNGNVYLTGYSKSFNGGNNETEPFVIKMDGSGNVLWSKKYLDDRSGGASPRQLIDHNGQLNFFTNNAKMTLDENGGILNERGIDFYRGISTTADGGFVLSAADNNFRKVVKMKTDGTAACEESAIAHTNADISFTLGTVSHSSNGVLVSKQFVTVLNPIATTVLGTDECGGPAPVSSQPFAKVLKETTPDDVNQVTDCVQADDGSTYHLLWSENGQLSVQHYDTAGQVVFSKHLPGISISPKGLDVDENGNVVVFGHTEDFGSGGSDFFASLIDASGTTLWSKVFGGVEDDFLQDGTFDANGDVVLVGYSNYSSNWKSIVTKIDRQSGGVRWMKVFDDPNNPYDFIESIQRLRDDNFLMIGKFSSEATVIKMDADGQVVWANEFPENNTSFPPKYDPEFYDIFEARSGEIYLAGKHNVFQFDFKINITKLNANGSLVWSKDFDDNGDNCFAEQVGIIDDQLLATYQVEGSDGTKLGVASFDLNGNSTGANRHTAIANYELRAGDIKSNIILAGSIDYVSTRDAFIFVLGEDGSLPCEEQSTSLNGSVVDLVPGNANIAIVNEPFGVTDLNLGAANKSYLVEDPCAPICLLDVEAIITHATCGESNASIDLNFIGNTGGVSFSWGNGYTGDDLTNIAAGEYAVTVTDAAGCEVVSSFIVQDAGEAPTVVITPTVDCNEVSFNTVVTGATTYSWTFGDGNSSTVEKPEHSYLLEGTFEVCLTVTNDCGAAAACAFVTITCATTFYADTDGDGFGNPDVTVLAVVAPPGFVSNDGDCDDTNEDINPAQPELCDGIDSNCNGMDDEPCVPELSYIRLIDSVVQVGELASYQIVIASGDTVDLYIDNVFYGEYVSDSLVFSQDRGKPGVHYLKLLSPVGEVIDEAAIRFEACGWSASIFDGIGMNLGPQDRCVVIKNGYAYAPPFLATNIGREIGETYWSNIGDFNVPLSDLELSFRLRNHIAEGGLGDQEIEVTVFGSRGAASFSASVAPGGGEVQLGDNVYDATGAGLYDGGWTDFVLNFSPTQLTLQQGGSSPETYDHAITELGDLWGMEVYFSGTGSIDEVSFTTSLGEIYHEDFDRCTCHEELAEAYDLAIYERELRIALPTSLAPALRAQNDLIVTGEFNGRYEGTLQREGQYLVFLSSSPFSAGEELNVTLAPGLPLTDGTVTEKYTWKQIIPARHVTGGKFFLAPLGVQVPSNALSFSYSFSSADFDGNGMMDVVFHYYTSYGAPSNQLIYLRNEDGTFQPPVAYTNSRSHSSLQGTPDLNGDGNPDILVRHNVPSSAMIRLNNGDGSFGAEQYYTVGNYSSGFAYGDLDADGDIDIISGSGLSATGGNTFTLLTNDGAGAFTATNTTTGIFNATRHLSDLDADGDLDLVYTSSTSFGSASRFRIYENDGTGQLALVVDQPNPGFQYVRQVIDLNGDDHLDLLLSTPNDVAVYGDGSLNYNYSIQDTLSSNRYVTTVVDVDADQDQDLLHTRRYDGATWTGPVERRERLPDGTYAFWKGVDTVLREALRPIDYDADGDIDHLALLEDRRIVLIENVDSAFHIDATLMLAGAFQSATGMMSDALRSGGYLPEVEPYGVDCQRVESDVLAVSGPTAIVDWIVVELRSDANHNVVLRSQTALLRRDGRVVDVDGESLVTFDLIPPAGYYISIRHRNHLGVMTALPNDIALRDTVVLDFTDATVTPTYGTEAQNEIAGQYVLRAGDANQDGIVRYSDLFVPPFTFIPSDALSVFTKLNGRDEITGYHAEDINMDGKVRYSDLFIPPFTIIPSDALRIFNALDGDPAGQEEERH